MLDLTQITKPTLLLDEARVRRNIQRMTDKAQASGVRFRPHLKTAQSAVIANWFREAGVSAVTVSSVEMAVYFAKHGWDDITVAFPTNIRQIAAINQLAATINLNLLIENRETAAFLQNHLTAPVNIWLEIDAGYGRSGLPWETTDVILTLAQFVDSAPSLTLQGLLSHAGNTYTAQGKTAVLTIFNQNIQRLNMVRDFLREAGIETAVSVGDTPGCALSDQFVGVDEIRPGNLTFFDLMQHQIGACTEEEIAVAVACPVVAIYPERGELILHGGAVHLSKEGLPQKGWTNYGAVCSLTEAGWGEMWGETAVVGLSQEHGVVRTTPDQLAQVSVGDLLAILPVHSCLTANLLRRYLTLTNEKIPLPDLT